MVRIFAPIAMLFVLSGFISGDQVYRAIEEGNVFYLDGNFDAALKAYERAEKANPESMAVQFNLGNTYFRQFEFGRATESYKRVLLVKDARLQSLAAYNLGNVRYQQSLNAMRTFKDAMRHIKIAIRYYRESLALNPDFADARYNLELAHRLYGEFQQQGLVVQRNPEISDEQTSVGRGRPMDIDTPTPSDGDDQGIDEETDEMAGQVGEKAPQGSPSKKTQSQSQPTGTPKDISAEEAAEMAELVRDKALAAESRRQQWKRARMRETGEAKTW